MTYTISIIRRAQRELANTPATTLSQIRDAIRNFSENPRPSGIANWQGEKVGASASATTV